MKHLFNTWRPFPKEKPEKDGWYQCTVEEPGQCRYVMNLYWYGEKERFKDDLRRDVFGSYDIYDYDKETHFYDKQIFFDQFCDRTEDVVAWKMMPKAYMVGFVEEDTIW